MNRCLDNITAGGVQICGLHATVAPRRQQQQTPPILEEFAFVPLVDTECLVSSEKLAEQLRRSKGKFPSSCFSSMCLKLCMQSTAQLSDLNILTCMNLFYRSD